MLVGESEGSPGLSVAGVVWVGRMREWGSEEGQSEACAEHCNIDHYYTGCLSDWVVPGVSVLHCSAGQTAPAHVPRHSANLAPHRSSAGKYCRINIAWQYKCRTSAMYVPKPTHLWQINQKSIP